MLRLGKTERSVAKKVAIYESVRSLRVVAKRSKLPKMITRETSSEPMLQSRYDEFKVHERFRYIIRFWSTKIRLDGKGASTWVCVGIPWSNEQVTNVAVARK